MSSGQTGVSCLSTEPHDDNIKNYLLHFLGCIKICEREKFLHGDVPIWERERDHQARVLKCKDADTVVEKKKVSWKLNLESEMQRISLLRETLANSDCHQDKQSVKEVIESGELWRQSKNYKSGIKKVKKWRKRSNTDTPTTESPTTESPTTESELFRVEKSYKLEEDISVPILQFNNSESTETDKRVKGKFPNQKTTIQTLLYESEPKPGLLYKDHESDTNHIKYFHIPSNNMKWAEEAIARYYGEEPPDFIGMQRQLLRSPKTNAYAILQHRYWRGRLHGDVNSPPHARYMSQMCEVIPSVGEKPNVALFMPYLHWETSRRQNQLAREIDNEIIRKAQVLAIEEDDAKKKRQDERKALHKKTALDVQRKSRLRRLLIPNWYYEGLPDIVRRVQQEQSSNFKVQDALGRYLLASAQLYENMSTYRDKLLLRTYLPCDPPIHPRRTLDQAYYWTLNSTKTRDKDQVIYRATTATRNAFHSYDEKTKGWPVHKELGGKECASCRTSIRKVSKIIMVDQLWMWVLDGRTLITCFPKRYGANKQDSSGVHKSIRTMIENLDTDQIRTVYELALIVLDACTTTFFDHAKSLDGRPQIGDEFSRAIGRIAHKQSRAFARLWQWTDDARKIFRSQVYSNAAGLHIPLLDINPEGKLEREIEDIIEELDIMLRISNTNKDIVKSFVEQAEHVLDPNGDYYTQFERNSRRKRGSSEGEYGNYESFKFRANELEAAIDSHIKDLDALRKSAKNTADDVIHLLNMKQQQASVVQTWQASKQSDETIKQGRSIMVFTLATIVFLPLSFLTSVFGMNNREFGDNNWGLGTQLAYIFSISAGVVAVSLHFAFSAWTRVWIWSVSIRVLTILLTKSGIYRFILWRKTTEDIFKDTYSEVDSMKMETKKQVFAAKVAKRKQKTTERRPMEHIHSIIDDAYEVRGHEAQPYSPMSTTGSSPIQRDLIALTALSALRSRRHGNENGGLNGVDTERRLP